MTLMVIHMRHLITISSEIRFKRFDFLEVTVDLDSIIRLSDSIHRGIG